MWMAWACKMRVEKFSVFFGPKLLGWSGKKTKEYQVASIPFGGFVQIAGMNPEEEIDPNDPGVYPNRPAFQRFLTIFAGPAINYIFAIFLSFFVIMTWGVPESRLSIGKVMADSPAQTAGLRGNDVILSIANQPVKTVEDVKSLITKSAGAPLSFHVENESEVRDVSVAAKEVDGNYQIGIMFGQAMSFNEKRSFGQKAKASIIFPLQQSKTILAGLKRLFTAKVKKEELGGPIAIVQQLKVSFESGIAAALLFVALLSIYLGIFNLLPIPALDGGRIVFLIFEMLTGKTLNPKTEAKIHTAFFMVLFALIIFVTYGDLKRIFFR